MINENTKKAESSRLKIRIKERGDLFNSDYITTIAILQTEIKLSFVEGIIVNLNIK